MAASPGTESVGTETRKRIAPRMAPKDDESAYTVSKPPARRPEAGNPDGAGKPRYGRLSRPSAYRIDSV